MPLRLWAPNARKVDLQTRLDRTPMRAVGGGWFEADIPGARGPGPGIDYGFRLDDSRDVLPDPRSPHQPHGPHGLSRTVDHAAFPWTDRTWQPPALATGLIYELHIGTFTDDGTFDSAIARLGHLAHLGVTHVELMPVAEFPGFRGWGYDGVNLFAPHHAYGGPDGLKRFINAAHQRGLAVLLDVVYNHLGPDGNYLPRFATYCLGKTPWGDALNLCGPDSDEVRRYVLDNVAMWLRDYHFDGLRLDAVHFLHDNTAIHILEEISAEVEQLSRQLGRTLILTAETDTNDPRLVMPRTTTGATDAMLSALREHGQSPSAPGSSHADAKPTAWHAGGGMGFDAHWLDEFHHALHANLTGESAGLYADYTRLEHLATSLKKAYIYAGVHCPGRRRRHGRPLPLEGVPAHRFIAFLQNHDQNGNRLRGERLAHLTGHDLAKVGAALLLLAPFVPMLWMGEEWAASSTFHFFHDHTNPALAKATAEGRRREFAEHGHPPEDVPDPQDIQHFRASTLKWSELTTDPHRSMLAWHRDLIALRRRCPDLTDPRLAAVTTDHDDHHRWLTVQRGRILLAANFSKEPRTISTVNTTGAKLLLTSRPGVELSRQFTLPPESVAVIETPIPSPARP